ncbi:hypothetical protein BU25DRAFT_416037 [Macroventuria anomochaeta]|uniref:Uncharacterized protein n=1 Tax=Macroventuria anomochaeta TaxID=301207 RepID=A0ACB6RHZ7_9PLEO|nr:uncharacterized protein BU25DRAFT_416037 [Macroventuria anomochaeta]KAF2621506.1 hypothetical protein BU25DRAFT_416037 [Macroventuria anomochaeta]
MPNESLRRNSSAMDAYKKQDSLDTRPATQIKEEQTSSDESQIKSSAKTRRRRASVACTSCRDRRIRCVVPSGKKACIQCERSSTSCIIKDDDERRRPISRAYVYSLVERVALLERLLEDQGLTVPPANHPPETRHRSRRSKDTSTVDNTSLYSSTPQESSISDDHTASLPYSSDDQIKDEHQTPNINKRSSVLFDVDYESGHMSKRMGQNSFIAPVYLRAESARQYSTGSVTNRKRPCKLDQLAKIPLSDQASLWSTKFDYSSDQATIQPGPQDTNIECRAYSAWGHGAFDLHGYNNHTLTVQYGEVLHTGHQYNAPSPPRGVITNLDFMPLNTSGWFE